MAYMHHPIEIFNYFNEVHFFLPPETRLIERIVLTGFIADYVALGKTRLLLKQRFRYSLFLVTLDIVGSVAISILAMLVLDTVFYRSSMEDLPEQFGNLPRLMFGGPIDPGRIGMYSFLVPSTLFTSAWTILIILSTITLRSTYFLQRLMGWFFDVDKHPVSAIGIVSAILTMLSSLVWSLISRLV
jgi:hypothetical protein